jgi:carbamoyl-phosphate synthase/aspartate carbamoyltransferase/dihydroorotase
MGILKIAGMIDPHVHLRDLEWAHKATFASETAAALAGGYWAVFDMPNTVPSTVDRAALDTKLAAIGRQAVCDWGLYFGASQPANHPEFPGAIDEVCGMKIYNNATTGNLLVDSQKVRAELYRHWPRHKPIAVHAENETVRDILSLVREHRVWTHFCHICTAEEIGYLRAAKEEGLPISVGVTPHHLYLSEDDVPRLGPLGWMKPNLQTRADQAALWEAIESGVVDVVESDHAPHTLAEKEADKPPYGVPGLETTLPLMALAVHEGRLTEKRLIELLAANAQRIFGLKPDDGTYTLVEMGHSFLIERQNLRTKCGWSPFEGMRVYGAVREVWIRGTKVFDGEQVLVEGGFGQNVGKEVRI